MKIFFLGKYCVIDIENIFIAESAKRLQILLSFAVGGLLGDVFLHLLPEAWANHAALSTGKYLRFKNSQNFTIHNIINHIHVQGFD